MKSEWTRKTKPRDIDFFMFAGGCYYAAAGNGEENSKLGYASASSAEVTLQI